MTNNNIQFQKQRDLGEIISDTFKFFRENYRLLFKLIFRITGPLLVILLLALTYNTYLMGGNMGTSITDWFSGADMGLFFISMFVLLCSLLGFYVLLHTTILHFINSYMRNDGNVIEKEVYQGVKTDFGEMLALLLLVTIITFFGLMLCVIPGIFLWVPLSIAPAVLIMGRTSITGSISDAYNLIKNNWWVTFGSLLVVFILMYIISFIFKVPMFIYMLVKTMVAVQEGSAVDATAYVDWIYIALNVVAAITQYLLSTIVIVATAFIYFDLNEKKNFTGTFETISKLGSSENK